MPNAEETIVEVDGRAVRVSNPNKVFFPQRGETKLDLVNYYLSVGEELMSTVRGRPLLLQRFPDGATGKSFYQKRVPAGAPDWLQTTTVETANGTPSNAVVAADMAHIVWAVNLGCLGFHPWPYKADDQAHTDELRIDLDPQPGTTFAMARKAAHETKRLFDEVGIDSYIKTTDNRELHVYVRLLPQWDSYQVRAGAVALARELGRRRPDIITSSWWKEERAPRIFIDFNQSAPHKTVFGAWCARSRTGRQVLSPFVWSELETVNPEQLHLLSVPERVRSLGDPWKDMNKRPQSLQPLLDMYGRDLDAGLGDAPWPPVYPKMPDEPDRVAPSRAKKPD